MCNAEPSLLDIMITHLVEFALDRQKYLKLAQMAHDSLTEKVKNIVQYYPEYAHHFVPEVQVGTDIVDCEYELID